MEISIRVNILGTKHENWIIRSAEFPSICERGRRRKKFHRKIVTHGFYFTSTLRPACAAIFLIGTEYVSPFWTMTAAVTDKIIRTY